MRPPDLFALNDGYDTVDLLLHIETCLIPAAEQQRRQDIVDTATKLLDLVPVYQSPGLAMPLTLEPYPLCKAAVIVENWYSDLFDAWLHERSDSALGCQHGAVHAVDWGDGDVLVMALTPDPVLSRLLSRWPGMRRVERTGRGGDPVVRESATWLREPTDLMDESLCGLGASIEERARWVVAAAALPSEVAAAGETMLLDGVNVSEEDVERVAAQMVPLTWGALTGIDTLELFLRST